MKSNVATTSLEESIDKERIDRMFYSIRNDLCAYRRISKRYYYVLILKSLLLIGKVLRSSKPYKIRKVKVIIKGLWKGIWFSPQIEFAE